MMPLAPPIPSRSVHPCRWFPARNGGSRSMTAFHDPGSDPIGHRALSFSPFISRDRLAWHPPPPSPIATTRNCYPLACP
jgi:hypothetical protein